jgi:protein phosphatase 1 regulatory subunit 7
LVNLKILDISNNRIKSLTGIETLTNLTDLWANDNGVEGMDEVESALKPISKTLEIVYLRGNPCSADEKYKLRMLFLLPKLEQLDDNPVER